MAFKVGSAAGADLEHMLFVLWVPLILQFLLPVGLLAWLTFGWPASRLCWALRAVLAAVYLAVIATAGLWLILPWYMPVVYAAGLLFATILSARRLREVPHWPRGSRGIVGALALAIAAGSCATLLIRLAVRAGDSVAVGEPLGRVGNTGNTGEPHLHIHAQRPGTQDAPLSGGPLPIRFGATYPSRNTRIWAPGRS